jgi:hypothetical protein
VVVRSRDPPRKSLSPRGPVFYPELPAPTLDRFRGDVTSQPIYLRLSTPILVQRKCKSSLYIRPTIYPSVQSRSVPPYSCREEFFIGSAPAAASLAPSSVRRLRCRKIGGRTHRPWQALALTLFRSARSGGTTSFADCGSELNWLVPFRPRPCQNSATFCKRSRRARFFAIFSTLNALRPRKSERNRLV